MNISRENIDELNLVLKLELAKEDYDERVNNVLKDYRKKANVPGFRPGKVPFGLINKMYRKPVLVEEVNKLVSESVSKFLIDEKLNILGEPLPHDGELKPIDWDKDESFEFKFDLGMAPEFELKLSTKDKIPFYNIKVDDSLIDKYADSYAQRFGNNIDVEEIKEGDIITAVVEQADGEGNLVEGGLQNSEARISTQVIKDDKIRKDILKLKKNDSLVFDLRKAYPNNTEIGSILKIKTEEAAQVEGDFKVTVTQIQRYIKSEINQELFDKVYGEGNVKSEKEFRGKITEEAAQGLKNDSQYKFRIDVKDTLVKKFKSSLPEAFLKRWLFAINEGKFSMEEIEKDFDKFVEDLKWQLLKDKITSENQIKVTEAEIKEAAKENARMQFSYYGMNNVPDEHLEAFANRTLEDKEQLRKISETKIEEKIVEHVRSVVKVDEKDITAEKFNKMFEEK
ncbi:MAG: trigger factor [Bacteroidales bacterium]|nr:trigger factor [Bacteroidales bacterium]MBN2818073.1 trigger factor [Bacteroidales bacterium]